MPLTHNDLEFLTHPCVLYLFIYFFLKNDISIRETKKHNKKGKYKNSYTRPYTAIMSTNIFVCGDIFQGESFVGYIGLVCLH